MVFTKSTNFAFALVLAVYFVAAVVKADSEGNKVKAFIMELAKDCQTGQITEEDMETMVHADHPTHEAKCFVACVMKKTGVMSEDGKYSPEGATEFSKKLPVDDASKNEEITAAITEKCGAMSGEDECETAFLIHQCAKELMKEHHG